MKERDRVVEIETRFTRLPNEVKVYLTLTEAISEMVPAQRTALSAKQYEYLDIINTRPELQAELANFVQFRNERRKIKG